MSTALPEPFGDYELIERLGVGGMAETFVAVRRGVGGFEQRVCLKRILPAFAGDAEFVDMFLREARLSALLHHGHIARVLDFGVANGTHYLALELVDGTDLRAVLRHLRVRAEGLDPGLVSYIAHALGLALDFAHAATDEGETKGIVHRDISPSNVLLSNWGEVKLADFGIAKAMNHPASVQSNDYELVKRLGVGGMAETFVAVRRGLDGFEQRVCLKRILPTFVNDPDFVEMFLREARYLRSCITGTSHACSTSASPTAPTTSRSS